MKSDKLPITGPCPIDLDAIGFDRKSKKAHCDHCDKSVHNLSNMTKAEAKVFLKENAGRKLCVSYQRQEGAILFKPAPPPTVIPLARVRASARRAAMPAAASLGLAAALAACTPHANDSVDKPTPTKVEKKVPDVVQTAGEAMVPPEPVVAGLMPIPEKPPKVEELAGDIAVPAIEQVEGEAPIIEELDGEIAIPDEPCDKAAK